MIGILGFGRFGALMAKYLTKDFEVKVWNRSDKSKAIRAAGGIPVSIGEACREKIVILAVPISTMENTLTRIAPLLNPGSVVVDVCSVKVVPVQWMAERLPEGVAILGTHPMFGPDSAAHSLKDRKIVLCPVRIEDRRVEAIRRYLSSKGLIVIETTPEDHDRQIAVSLSLTHFIGRSLAEFGAGDLLIDTEGYKRLLYTLGVVTHDTWQLFEDMHRFNPYAEGTRDRFITAMDTIDKKLREEL